MLCPHLHSLGVGAIEVIPQISGLRSLLLQRDPLKEQRDDKSQKCLYKATGAIEIFQHLPTVASHFTSSSHRPEFRLFFFFFLMI